MSVKKGVVVSKQAAKLAIMPFVLFCVSPSIAASIPAGWESSFDQHSSEVHVIPGSEAKQITGAAGPAVVALVGAIVGAGGYAGSNLVQGKTPSAEGTLIAGALGATGGLGALLPVVPGAIVAGTAGIGASVVTGIIDSRPVGPYGSFPPDIGHAGNCTPWTCAWKDGQPVPLGTPGATNW